MSEMLPATAAITVNIGGLMISQVTRVEIARDLADITGTFSFSVVDWKRVIGLGADISADVDG